MNRKNKIIVLCSSLALIGIFAITYNVVSNKINNRNKSEETAVYNNGQKALKESLVIALYSNNKNEKTLTLEDFKKEYRIDKTLTEENVKEILGKEGYEIDKKTDEVFTFKRTVEKKKEANKYFIGEHNGYLAIYKSDENGKLDLIREYETSLDLIRLSDAEMQQLKDKTYFSSESLEEVEEEMTELNS